MASRILWAACALAVATLIFLGVRDLDPPPSGGAAPARASAEERREPRLEEFAPASAGVGLDERAEVAASTATPAANVASLPAERGRADLEIAVVHSSGAPASRIIVRVRSHTGPRPELYELADDRGIDRSLAVDERGRARLADLPTGPYEVLASANEREAPTCVRTVLESPSSSVRIELRAPGLEASELLVRVLGEQREPIVGAVVEVTGGAGDLRSGRTAASVALNGTTGERGELRLADPGLQGLVAVAIAPDGRMGSTTAWSPQDVASRHAAGGLEIQVGAPASLRGALTGLAVERLAGARVRAHLLDQPMPYAKTHGCSFETPVEGGRYAFESLAPGTYTLQLLDPGGARLALPSFQGWGQPLENSVDPLEVELAAGANVELDLAVAEGGVIEGLVVDERGAPLQGAAVRATLAPRTSNVPDGFYVRGANVWRFDSRSGGEDDHPETHLRARSDTNGRYRLAGLHVGLHRLEVALPGRLYDRREGIEVQAGATVRLEHALLAAGAIQGIARAGGYLGVQRSGASAAHMVAILPSDGSFCFPGLEPGSWIVTQFHSDAGVAPVPLVEVEVQAGRTTWVDLERDGVLPVRIAGRVLEADVPVSGASVVAWPRRLVTDAAGRFEVSSAYPWTNWVAFSVERGGLTTDFQFPGMETGAQRWEGDLHLGEHVLAVRAEDADGLPAPAQLALWLHAADRAEIRQVRAESLAIGPSGELRVPALPTGTYEARATFADGAEAFAQVALPRAGALVLRSPAVGSLEVLVRHDNGRAAVGWEVQIGTWIGEGIPPGDDAEFLTAISERRAVTGSDGRAALAGVRAGDLLVRAQEELVAWRKPNVGPAASARLHLARGQRAELELVLRQP